MKRIYLTNEEIYKLKKEGTLVLEMDFFGWIKLPEIGDKVTVCNTDKEVVAKAEMVDFSCVAGDGFKVAIKYIQKVCN